MIVSKMILVSRESNCSECNFFSFASILLIFFLGHPPWHHAPVRVLPVPVAARRPGVLRRPPQLLRPRRDVLLLLPGGAGARIPEVPLVEEIPHHLPDAAGGIFRH